MKKIAPVRGRHSALSNKKLHVVIGAGDEMNKNVDGSVKISEEGKKKLIIGHIMASLIGDGSARGM